MSIQIYELYACAIEQRHDFSSTTTNQFPTPSYKIHTAHMSCNTICIKVSWELHYSLDRSKYGKLDCEEEMLRL
jgi:hypothetical protein